MSQLNPQQQSIIEHHGGAALVIAGAGSGKTRVITHRVAKLIEKGVAPHQIMMVTFTNKAAKEMLTRVEQTIGGESTQPRKIIHGTFHSIANRFLRRYAQQIEYRANFSILDSSDAKELIKSSISEAIPKIRNFPSARVLQDIFSLAFNQNADSTHLKKYSYATRHFQMESLLLESHSYLEKYTEEILRVHQHYRQKKHRNQAMDFDDLLEYWLELLLRYGTELPLVRQIQYVLVDEFQDTNKVQSSILEELVKTHQNLMVVGDDAQSIYSWRGANFRNILDFPEKYQATVYRLEQNYRSTPNILELANSCIRKNKEQFEKNLFTSLSSFTKPNLYRMWNTEEEATIIVEEILQLRDQDIPYEEICVMYRNHMQAAMLEIALTQANIPFIIHSGVKFFEQAHLKDLLAFLKVVFNPLDEIAWLRILKMLPGIGNRSAQKIFGVFLEQNAVRLTPENQQLNQAIPKKAKEHWLKLLRCFEKLLSLTRPKEMIVSLYEQFYQNFMELNFENYFQREPDIQYFIEFAQRFASLEEMLNELSLVGSSLLKEQEENQREEEGCMTLTTIHQAKGLEWDVVFIIGLTEGQFPHQRSVEPTSKLEEERRLFYVAVTRARRQLVLTSPLWAMGWSNTGGIRSRFIEELDSDLLEAQNYF